MKTLKEFKTGDKAPILEAKDKLPDPPMILLLKRRAIRLYPQGKRVALYHNDKLGIDISIPYSPSNLEKEIPGFASANEEVLSEKEHDDLFGDYTHALKSHYETGARHADHPELAKLKHKVVEKYGREAHGHLHAAAEHYLNGDVAKAARRYSKFEGAVHENFLEVADVDQISEGVIHKLHHITQSKTAGKVVFKDGSTADVQYPQAAHIMKLHSKVEPGNKATIEKLVNASPAGLAKVADFAAENLK